MYNKVYKMIEFSPKRWIEHISVGYVRYDETCQLGSISYSAYVHRFFCNNKDVADFNHNIFFLIKGTL